jgi:hypothetical protein
VALLLLIAAVGLLVYELRPRPLPVTPAEATTQLRDAAWRVVSTGGLARDDGAVYAVDIGQLATYAALAGDRELYDPLRRVILEQLMVRREPGNLAHGMIAWRAFPDPRPNQPARDASGTTEALRCAEALWRGVQAFGLDEDREVIRLILDAYVRHATPPDQSPWMIRNYFNLHPDVWHFITNSFLVDYDPDLLLELSEAFDEPAWRDVAERSAELIDRARTPADLLHQVIRPEVATIMPAFAADGIYSIDGVEQLSNVLTVAERCTDTNPEVAAAVLAFARQRLDRLGLYYDATTGRRVEPPRRAALPGVETWGPLLRLADQFGDEAVRDAALRKICRMSPGLADPSASPRLYLIGEALLALHAAEPDAP